MSQFDCRDENDHCLSRSADLSLHFGNPLSYLISQTMEIMGQPPSGFPTLESSSAEEPEGLDERKDCLNQPEDCSPVLDISSALRSVALMGTWNFGSLPSFEEDDSTLSSDDQDTSAEGAAAAAKEEALIPLYQDYCLQEVKEMYSLSKSFVSEPIARLSFYHTSQSPSRVERQQVVTLSSPPPNLIRVHAASTLWQDLDEVKAAGLLSSLTTRQIRLQESTFELIGSEASYLRSLGVAVDHFYASMPLKQTLSQMEHHILFSNIRRVKAASERFLMDLTNRLGQSVVIYQVGDIVLEHCPAFCTLYVPYVTNMMYQEALINQLLKQNTDFVFSLSKLESDPVCQRQHLKSFLVLPFQRITRIKLILESILKLTDSDSDTVSTLEKAIEAIHEIVMECDKGVKKMKQIEELVCLEMLLDFGKLKSIPLVVNGRFLVREGPVRQLDLEMAYNLRTSFISIYLHLFNDLLIISSKKDQRFVVEDHAEYPTHVNVKHLKTEVLVLPPDSFLLHLSKSQTGQPTIMILVPHTRSDKEVWMKMLSSKQ
ncbi:rho guanine nucleotide exchange factor 19 [Scomber scombrus]|uniref:Rho guanine nucleotide exchange factor 19 n=2 Tax=Scomber scombrus TaxID=13677 RepID=A0AAV1MZQ4_SCOSC